LSPNVAYRLERLTPGRAHHVLDAGGGQALPPEQLYHRAEHGGFVEVLDVGHETSHPQSWNGWSKLGE
jgi:hypothetical protein